MSPSAVEDMIVYLICCHGNKMENVIFLSHPHAYVHTHTHNHSHTQGQLVLNGKTDVRSIPDKGTRRYRFGVTCGHTGVLFEISADDQRMKHDWMLAIRKVGGYVGGMGWSVGEKGGRMSVSGGGRGDRLDGGVIQAAARSA